MEIIQQRANAIKLLGRTLDAARAAGKFSIAAISGGSKSNAIAREAQGDPHGDALVLAKIKAIVDRLSRDLSDEFSSVGSRATLVAASPARCTGSLTAHPRRGSSTS